MHAMLMEKAAVIDQFTTTLRAELQSLTRAAHEAFAAATDPGSKAENKYDTRTLEASYVARGQAQRVAELQEAVLAFEGLSKLPMEPGRPVTIGSLLTLDTPEGAMHCLLGPCAGGTEIVHEGEEVFIITPASSMGQKVIGRRLGESFSLRPGNVVRIIAHQ